MAAEPANLICETSIVPALSFAKFRHDPFVFVLPEFHVE